MRKMLIAALALASIVALGARGRAQVVPPLPGAKVGVCQVPADWGHVKAATVYQTLAGRNAAVLVLENEAGEIRFVDHACTPVLTIGRE